MRAAQSGEGSHLECDRVRASERGKTPARYRRPDACRGACSRSVCSHSAVAGAGVERGGDAPLTIADLRTAGRGLPGVEDRVPHARLPTALAVDDLGDDDAPPGIVADVGELLPDRDRLDRARVSAHVASMALSDPGEQLFRTQLGRLWQRNNAGEEWRRIRQAAGLSADVTLHTLRHTYASNLIASGCDVVTVQRALGHSQPSITLNVYSHLWPSAEDHTRAATADFMASVTGSADSLRTGTKKPQVGGRSYR